MFICRHVLLRTYTPSRTSRIHIHRRLLAEVPDALRPKIDTDGACEKKTDSSTADAQKFTDAGNAGASHPVLPTKQQKLLSAAADVVASSSASDGLHILPWFPNTPAVQTKMRRKADPSPQDDPLAFYATLRKQGLSLFKDTNLEYAAPILVAVAEKKKAKIAHLLVQDILSNGHHVGQTYRSIMLENVLLLVQQNLLDKEQVAALLGALRSFDQLMSINEHNRVPIAIAILNLPAHPRLDPHINDTLATLLVGVLVDTRARSESDEVGQRSRKAAELLMFIACDLAAAGMRVRSMEIVNALVQTHSVPPSAVYHANLMSTDFSLIVLTMSVHSALHLGWRSTAGKLMIKALLEGPEDSQELAALAVEVLRMLTDVPDESDSGFSASILVQLMTRYSSHSIPHHLIQAFYAGTQLLNQAHLAEVLYSVSFTPKKAYPPPQGRLLVWFMTHLTKKSKNAHLARQLATHVVEAQIPLPVLDRGRFIGLIASQGFATQARALWERYALVESSNDRNFVVGSAGAMLRVVSLFTSLARREGSARLDNAEEEEKLPDSEVVDVAASVPLEGEDEAFPPREFCWPAQGPRLEPAKSVSTGNTPQSVDPASSADVTRAEAPIVDSTALGEVHGATPSELIGQATSDTCPSGAADHPQEHVGALSSEKAPALDAVSTVTVVEDSEADFKEFATRVFKTYYASRRPLIHTHHFELNALARAAFMLGRLEEGLRIFQLMLKRRQVPDLVDVNVVLEMLAQYNPTAAARVLERMVTVGLMPDATSFGSVIHHAVVHRDMVLVEALLRRAQELGVEQLSYQTMGTLIRGLIETDEDRRNDSRHALKTVQDLVGLLLKAGQIPSPNMGRDCVIAAMRAEDAEAAFWFWDMLMRDKVEWEDEMQTKLRKAIARLVRRHWRAGRVMDVHARMMLVQMRERPIMGRGPSRRVPERKRKAAAGGGKKS